MNSRNTPEIIRKRVRELEPGLVVARDIHSRQGCRLLQEGDKIAFEDIQRLKNWNKRVVHVYDPEDQPTDNPPMAQAS